MSEPIQSLKPTSALPCLRVRNWNDKYENNRTRGLKRLEWLPLTNDQASDSFTDLIDHECGLAHFGALVTVLQLASKCSPRGTLVRANGQAHTTASIARITRVNEIVLNEAIARLVEIGDLEWIDLDDSTTPQKAWKRYSRRRRCL